VPHGAVRLGTNDQVRALFASPVMRKSEDGRGFVRSETVLVGIIVTGRGSERPVGFVFVFVGSDGCLVVPTTTDGRLIRIPGEGLGLDSCAVAKRVGWCAMSRGGRPWRELLVI